MNTKFSFKSAIIIFFGLLILSCKNDHSKETITKLKPQINNILGKKLVIPEDMSIYEPFTSYVADSSQIALAGLKVYTYINASCSTCIQELNLWKEIIPDFIENGVAVIVILYSHENFEILKHACESGLLEGFQLPFFLDNKNELSKRNLFMRDSNHFQTVLTNNDGTIFMVGNPIHSNEIKRMYFDEIANLIKGGIENQSVQGKKIDVN